MALRESEAIVLRRYQLREADLLVTMFTRIEGKVRGVARSAKKSKRRFGGALEPLTYVRAFYDVRERQELARLAFWRGPVHLPPAPGTGAARFLRGAGIPHGLGGHLCAGGRPGSHRGIARRTAARLR